MQMALPASWEGYARSHLSHKTSTLLPWLITRDPSSPPLHNTLLMSHVVIAPWIIDLCVLHWGTLCQSFWPLQWPWHAPVPCHRVDEGVTSLASRVWSQKGSNSVGCHDTGIFVDCARVTQFPTPYEAMAGRPTAVRDSGITSCDSGLDIEAGWRIHLGR